MTDQADDMEKFWWRGIRAMHPLWIYKKGIGFRII